jgi:phosphate:Na+ symporter
LPPIVEGVLKLIGALGIFLYATSRFGDGVQKMAGEKIRVILETQTRSPLSSVTTGIGMAAVLQSNVLTFGMISSLVNAGLLGLLPALWIMLGVNLGITITAHLMAIKLGAISFLLLLGGYLLYSYGKKRNWHYFGQILFNLGLMYLGFEVFYQAYQILAIQPGINPFIKPIFLNPWFGFILGLGLAALFRSSNTIVVLIQSAVGVGLALSVSDFFTGAFAIIIGANVGATIINMLVGLDRVSTVKKVNWFLFSFNCLTALLWLAFLPFAITAVREISQYLRSGFQWFEVAAFQWPIPRTLSNNWFSGWDLAMAHTLFNMVVICIWFPLTIAASKMKIVMFSEKGKIGTSSTSFLDRRALQSPALALILAGHEINQMATIALEMLKSARQAFLKGQVHLLNSINRDESMVDDLQEQITFYLSALLSQNSLTEAQSQRLAGLLHVVSDIERVGDHANNIASLAEKRYREQLPFSELAVNEMELFFGKSLDLYCKACQALRENNLELAKQVQTRESNMDKLEEELRQNHIHRLNQGKCWPGSGVIYVEMLSNLERVAAHAANIATVILNDDEG